MIRNELMDDMKIAPGRRNILSNNDQLFFFVSVEKGDVFIPHTCPHISIIFSEDSGDKSNFTMIPKYPHLLMIQLVNIGIYKLTPFPILLIFEA